MGQITADRPAFEQTRVLLADDHVLVAQGVERLLREHFRSVQLVASSEEMLQAVRSSPPDVVVSDISMPGLTGIEAMRRLRSEGHKVPFLFLTMHTDAALAAAAIRGGASGYLLKSAAGDELVRGIREVLAGRTYVSPAVAAGAILAESRPHHSFTDKQHEILLLVAQGLRSKQIAHMLGVSVRTVESHKYAMMQEMGVHGTLELVRKAELEGLLHA